MGDSGCLSGAQEIFEIISRVICICTSREFKQADIMSNDKGNKKFRFLKAHIDRCLIFYLSLEKKLFGQEDNRFTDLLKDFQNDQKVVLFPIIFFS